MMRPWSRAWHALVGAPVALPSELLAQWPELARARYRRGGLPPRVGGWCLGTDTVGAITLWSTIWLGSRTRLDDVELLLHELRHVEQFARDRTFPLQYVWESARRGYHRNRFEVDAVRYAARRVRAPHEPSTEDV
jgi:hypothetical protein